MGWQPTVPKPKDRLTREQKKAQTRDALLGAAHRLFAAKGFEATTVDEVASTAGFTRGAFYANFGNKEAVMEALIARGFSGDLEAIDPIEGVADVRTMKEEYQEYSRRFLDDPESLMWSLEFQMAALRHPELRPEYIRQYRRIRDRVAEMLTSMLESEGHPNPKSMESLAEVFVVLQTALSAQRLLDPERVSEDIFSIAFDVLIQGMLVKAE